MQPSPNPPDDGLAREALKGDGQTISLHRCATALPVVFALPCSAEGTRLEGAGGTTDGEILNVRRFAFLASEGTVEGVKYLERDREGLRFRKLVHFLDQVTHSEGFAYKDVIHPFLMADWLPTSPVRALYLGRPVPDVAFAMRQQGWLYPATAAEPSAAGSQNGGAELERAMVSGLLRAKRALDNTATVRVRYDDLIQDEAPLWDALRSLYGGDVPRPAYLDEQFRRVRDERLLRRGTPLYQRLQALYRELGGMP